MIERRHVHGVNRGGSRVVFFIRERSRAAVAAKINEVLDNDLVLRSEFTEPSFDDGRFIAMGFMILKRKTWQFYGDDDWNDTAKDYTLNKERGPRRWSSEDPLWNNVTGGTGGGSQQNNVRLSDGAKKTGGLSVPKAEKRGQNKNAKRRAWEARMLKVQERSLKAERADV